ncbi:hypothetical protein PR202_gb16114 [Eleusine coracana subsp. coracana]|uniref:Secreted protein n=1 Tax=Eleusine coracana subsp. coracana TaxID=191504 RepID=A0AAV5EXD2_ELECO|nr:hypothetical protein PR202_gb16114 [Eleusine coracana subsp. coracana]
MITDMRTTRLCLLFSLLDGGGDGAGGGGAVLSSITSDAVSPALRKAARPNFRTALVRTIPEKLLLEMFKNTSRSSGGKSSGNLPVIAFPDKSSR